MINLNIRDVRCFFGEHITPIRPMTVLVGENSTGKSTFLALSRIAWDIAHGEFLEDIFNEEPFLLGAYEQIASYKGGKAGRAKSFTVGARFEFPRQSGPSALFSSDVLVSAKFVSSGAQARLQEWSLESGKFKAVVHGAEKERVGGLTIYTDKGSASVPLESFARRSLDSPIRALREVSFGLGRAARGVDQSDSSMQSLSTIMSEHDIHGLDEIHFALRTGHALGERPYAFAPIRTKPQRTYDPVKDIPKPEGSHVPMLLAKTYSSDKSAWATLKRTLVEFGHVSGLFDDLEIKRKGQKESDPFQIAVKALGPACNLVDVGYGVSQVLPIVVDVLQGDIGASFLLQQPEIHLHPRAQAELATFLTTLIVGQQKRFIVETHSDYFIDRLRLDVRDNRTIKFSDVMIVYFERARRGVKVYPLQLDEQGNIVSAPKSYRKFFLDEEKRFWKV